MEQKREIYEILQYVAMYATGQIDELDCNWEFHKRLLNFDEIRFQFCKILMSNDRVKGSLRYLTACGVMDELIPDFGKMVNMEQPSKYHTKDVFDHTVEVVQRGKTFEHRLAGLLHDIGKVHTFSHDPKTGVHFYGHQDYSYKIAKVFLKKMKFDDEVIDKISLAVKYHMIWKDKTIKNTTLNKYINKHGKRNVIFFLELALMDSKRVNTASNIDLLEYISYVSNFESPSISTLPIDGNDIAVQINCNGKMIGKCKALLIEEFNKNPNMNRQECIQFLKNEINKINEVKQ